MIYFNCIIEKIYVHQNLTPICSTLIFKEILLTKGKFMKADYPLRFINSVVNEFQKGKECGDESFINSTGLFEIGKPFIFFEIPCCELNKIKSKFFRRNFINSLTVVSEW